jgi:small subunit ribosomal protein S8
MPRILNGYGIAIVSTSDGIITGRKAVEKQVGGELICTVW